MTRVTVVLYAETALSEERKNVMEEMAVELIVKPFLTTFALWKQPHAILIVETVLFRSILESPVTQPMNLT